MKLDYLRHKVYFGNEQNTEFPTMSIKVVNGRQFL